VETFNERRSGRKPAVLAALSESNRAANSVRTPQKRRPDFAAAPNRHDKQFFLKSGPESPKNSMPISANVRGEIVSSERIRVLMVDDHPLLSEGLAAVIQSQDDMVPVGQASSGLEAIKRFDECRPDVTLMDLRLPDISGIDAMTAIQAKFPEAR